MHNPDISKVTTIEYELTDFDNFLYLLANNLGASVVGNRFEVPSNVGKGEYISSIANNGISFLVSDCIFNNDFIFERYTGKDQYFALELGLYPRTGQSLEEQKISDYMFYSIAKNNRVNYCKSGLRFQKINILLPFKWVENNYGLEKLQVMKHQLATCTNNEWSSAISRYVKDLVHIIIEKNFSKDTSTYEMDKLMEALIDTYIGQIHQSASNSILLRSKESKIA